MAELLNKEEVKSGISSLSENQALEFNQVSSKGAVAYGGTTSGYTGNLLALIESSDALNYDDAMWVSTETFIKLPIGVAYSVNPNIRKCPKASV